MSKPCLVATTAGRIQWLLALDDPTEIVLSHPHGWSILTPLHPTLIDLPMTEIQVMNKLDGKLWIWSQSICLSPPGELTSDDMWPVFDEMLKRLRFVSGQFEIPRILVACALHDLTSGELVHDWSSYVGSTAAHVRRYMVDTAIRHDHLQRLAELPADFSPPVHVDVLLDAIEAAYAQDCRKALLYAAIASSQLPL